MAEAGNSETPSALRTFLGQWIAPAITALCGLAGGVGLASYNFDLATSRFFLEKQAETANHVATEFSRYVDNWSRMVQMRKKFDAMDRDPDPEQKDYFKKAVFDRKDARDKLFSHFDATHLYYSEKTSNLILRFRDWDEKQSDLTVDKLPDIAEWRKWQIDILRQLRSEIIK